ncbi:hypothetical protein AB1K54_10175 [Microbacterium sp. BWT-B31]|uniref:DUF7507 domain-containing protein n=1 Tax=Microbacterium sp. BWT-B31 TaxID=3232072 RepID=UPI0035291A31
MGGAPDGYLQLTDASTSHSAAVLYDQPLSARAGISITFDLYQYGGSGADGVSFFLVDGSVSLTHAGAPGGSLGYAQRGNQSGVDGAYLGVGLDAWGNFFADTEGRGTGCPPDQRSPGDGFGFAPQVITLRGPGQGQQGYCWIDATIRRPIKYPGNPGTSLNGGTGTLRAGTREQSHRVVNLQVTPVTASSPVPRVIVQVQYQPNGPWVLELDAPGPPNPPSTYKLGYSGSTGGATDVHLVRNVVVSTVEPIEGLILDKQVDRSGPPLAPVLLEGSHIPYQYTVTNVGAPVHALHISDDRVVDGSITCDRTSLTMAPAAGSVAVCRGFHTVTAEDVAAGSVTNVATADGLLPAGNPIVSNPDTVTVPLHAAVELEKHVETPPPYSPGQQVTYAYTVRNTGGADLVLPRVTDNRIPWGTTCESTTVPVGRSTTCRGTHTLESWMVEPDGYVVNTASVTAQTSIGQTVTDGPVTARIPLGLDIAVTKSVDDPTPQVGSAVTFTVTAINNGPADATGIVITDVIPGPDPASAIEYLSSTPAAHTTYDAASGAWSIPTLAVGEQVALEITALANTSTPYTNTAALTHVDQPDLDRGNNTAQATIRAFEPSVDIAVTKTVDRERIPVGAQAVFTVTASNSGPSAATGIELLDPLPAGLALDPVSSTGNGVYDSGTATWSIDRIDPGQSASRTFVVTGVSLGTYTNLIALTGNSGAPDSDPTNNSASAQLEVIRATADLAVSKSVEPATATIGDTVVFELRAENLGPDAAQAVVVTDILPNGLTVIETTATTGAISSDGAEWEIGDLAPGQTGVVATITVLVSAAGAHVNTATIGSALVDDPDLSNNSASATVQGTPPVLDLAVTKSVFVPSGASPTAVPVGEEVEFVITVSNPVVRRPLVANDVILTDQLPVGLTYLSSSGNGTYDEATGLWSLRSIAPDGTAVRTIRARVDEAAVLSNTVTLSSLAETDRDPTNNSATTAVTGIAWADLAITKTVEPEITRTGNAIEYTLRVRNNGSHDATEVAAFDPLMPNATLIDAEMDMGSFDPTTRIWQIGDLPDAATATLTVHVSTTRPGLHRNTAVVHSSRQPDQEPRNNEAFADIYEPSADIVVVKAVDRPAILVGEEVVFTVGVTNRGPDIADAVTVADSLPAGLEYVSHTATIGRYDPHTGDWSVGDLPVADPDSTEAQGVLLITAVGAAAGTFTNHAASDRSEAFAIDPDPYNNAAQATTVVTAPPAELHVTKRVDRSAVQIGDTVTYTIEVRNSGNADAESVAVIDEFPSGIAATQTSTPGCAINGQVLSCDLGAIGVGATASIDVSGTARETGQFTNTAVASTPEPLSPLSTLSASASVEVSATTSSPAGPTSLPPTGPTSLPPTGASSPPAVPPLGGILIAAGMATLLAARHRPRPAPETIRKR